MRINWISFGEVAQLPDGSVEAASASLRYRVLIPIREMRAAEYRHAVFPLNQRTVGPTADKVIDTDLLIISKSVVPENGELFVRAAERGVRIIFDVCDNHFQHPLLGEHYRMLAGFADQVICNTPQTAQAAAPFCKTPPIVISDPYEGEKQPPAFAPGAVLKLLWFGHPLNLPSLQASMNDLAAYSHTQPLELIVLSQESELLRALVDAVNRNEGERLRMSARLWSRQLQQRALARCDAVIIPTPRDPARQGKSANRVVETLWAGRPAVAQPLPAYEPFARWTPIRERLSEGLAELLAKRELAPRAIAKAQDHIHANFDPAKIALQWEAVIQAQYRQKATAA
jgi:hypothetical protein